MNYAPRLPLVLCAVLFVTSGFAATKKIQRNDGSRDWNDLSLQNGDRPSVGSSVSSGSFGFQSSTAPGSSGSSLILGSPGTPDNWNGGIGNWSNAGNWSAGSPGASSDVTIYSGYDYVALDTSPTINTLTLGGTTGSSTLYGDGTQTLTIAGALTVGQNGTLLGGADGGISVTASSLVNSGLIVFELPGGLQVNGDANNSGLLESGFETSGHMINITGMLTNSGEFYVTGLGDAAATGSVVNTGSIDVDQASTLTVNGDVSNSKTIYTDFLLLGGGNTITINGTLTNNSTGSIDLEGASTLTVNGDVRNSGFLRTALILGGGNTVNITGALTNSGTFQLNGRGDMATLGGLVNAGTVDVENGSKLQINGDASNSGTLGTSLLFGSGKNTLNITGTLTNNGTFEINGFGDRATIGGDVTNSGTLATGASGTGRLNITGTLTNNGTFEVIGFPSRATIGGNLANSGFVDLEAESTLQINGNVTNSGILGTEFKDILGGNTITINGTLTNNAGAQFILNSGGNGANVGTLVNSGIVFLDEGALLNLTNQPNGITDIVAGSLFRIAGSLLIAGNKSAFANLTSVEGGLTLAGQDITTTPGGGVLTVSSSGRVFLTGADQGSTTLHINGDVNNSGQISIDTFSNYLTITGALTNASGGSLTLYGPYARAAIGSVDNSGSIDLQGGASTLTVNGDVKNSGTIMTEAKCCFIVPNNTINITGTLTNNPGGQINLTGSGDTLNAMMSLTNNGGINLFNGSAVSTPTLNNGGTINVDSLSTLLVGTGIFHGPSYNYTQLANGTLGEIINSPNSFGFININGSALLNGTLDILLKPGFDPRVGSIFQFLFANPGQISGTFANIQNQFFNNGTEEWLVTYDNTDGIVELTAEKASPVPEPATLLVLIPGLLGAGFGLRRRLLQ